MDEVKAGSSLGNRVAWGKRRANGDYHPLADHCLDVAVIFSALSRLPVYRERLIAASGQMLLNAHLDRLALLAFLHDFGKCNRGFQAKADPKTKETAGHVLEALALLLALQNRWPPAWAALIADIATWFRDEEQALQMLVASISHHGRPVSLNDYESCGVDRAACKLWSPAEDYDPLAALDALAVAARQAFPQAFAKAVPPIDATPALQQRFAGLVMLADWIGSDTQFFPYRQSETEDRMTFAKEVAERALRAIGLIPSEPRRPKPFTTVFPFGPTPLQKTLAEDLEANDDTRLLLAESDTGSGKTEAAIAWFFRLYAEGKVDGLYFALPTRVAARELYERVLRAVKDAFDDDHPGPVLLAAPGYVKVDGEALPPLLTDPQGTLWDDSASDRQRERLWSAERPKRFLAAPIAVGTIDQALLSVLQVKHSLMRSVCLDRHLLVVDEVHASDPYMREVLQSLLRGHTARGGWALLLSATLGEVASASFFGREPLGPDEAIAKPYPLLSTRTRRLPMPAARERYVRIELTPTMEDDAALLPGLIEALSSGARVLVVCNTVQRANALFALVEAALQAEHPHLLPALFAIDGVRCPHHGRFAREDRERMDAAVTAQMGKHAPAGARIIIGTQTLEQSLDIDADWLITDLAPMDVLIQRLGRLHRHPRDTRPSGFDVPQALIRVPVKALDEYLDKNGTLRAPAGLGSAYVYADGRVLACTWEQLRQHPTITLPAQARALIERSTHPDAFAQLPLAWRDHGQNLEGKQLSEIRQALCSVMDDQPFGDLHYADKNERVLTRLGSSTFDVPLSEPVRSPFGADIRRVSIPSHWLENVVLPDAVCVEPTDEGFRFRVGTAQFRYTRFGLEKDDV